MEVRVTNKPHRRWRTKLAIAAEALTDLGLSDNGVSVGVAAIADALVFPGARLQRFDLSKNLSRKIRYVHAFKFYSDFSDK